MTPVIVESPFAGCVPLHRAYLQACIRDCLARGETPYASHQMLTWALDDEIPEEREMGISAGLKMRDFLAESCNAASVFYVDFGWSSGMERARSPLCAWLTRSIENDIEWHRIADEACIDPAFKSAWSDVFYVSAFSGLPIRQALLKAREVYIEQKARVA